jgi:hypothetical protein
MIEVGDIICFDKNPKELFVIVERASNSAASWLAISLQTNNREWVFYSRYYRSCKDINSRWRFMNDV